MARRLRFVPPGSLVEVTCRTMQGRLLLRPTRRVNELVLGVLGRSVRLYPVQVHAFQFLSNHYHLLATVPSAQRLAAFMNYLNSNLAREIGRAVDWPEKFWGRRYQVVLVDADEAAQVGRLVYLLSQGTKENLVWSPRDWPGASSLDALLSGDPVRGKWVDRTLEYRCRRARLEISPGQVCSEESFDLVPLPCWRDLSRSEYRARVATLVAEIESQCSAHHRNAGTEPLGLERILRKDSHLRAAPLRRTPTPLVHASNPQRWRAWRMAYDRFVLDFRSAAEALKRGARDALFPEGSFPPSLPYVAFVAT